MIKCKQIKNTQSLLWQSHRFGVARSHRFGVARWSAVKRIYGVFPSVPLSVPL